MKRGRNGSEVRKLLMKVTMMIESDNSIESMTTSHKSEHKKKNCLIMYLCASSLLSASSYSLNSSLEFGLRISLKVVLKVMVLLLSFQTIYCLFVSSHSGSGNGFFVTSLSPIF